MLDAINRLQTCPILEPDHPVSIEPTALDIAEDLYYEVFDCSASKWREIVGDGVNLKEEFGPHNQMGDVSIDGVGPVIPENLVVGRVIERRLSRRCHGWPIKALLPYILQHGAVFLVNVGLELQIASKITWDAAKAGKVVPS